VEKTSLAALLYTWSPNEWHLKIELMPSPSNPQNHKAWGNLHNLIGGSKESSPRHHNATKLGEISTT
jgi:hypothetical protein